MSKTVRHGAVADIYAPGGDAETMRQKVHHADMRSKQKRDIELPAVPKRKATAVDALNPYKKLVNTVKSATAKMSGKK